MLSGADALTMQVENDVLWSLGGDGVFDVKCKPRRQAFCWRRASTRVRVRRTCSCID